MNTQHFSSDDNYLKAKEKVQAIKGFYSNLFAYTIVISALAFVNYQTTSFVWVVFPALGWGFGLLWHGLEAFGYHPLFGKKWEERKIKELLQNS